MPAMQLADLDIGRVGLWTAALEAQPATKVRELVAQLDEQGWGALWVPEAVNREVFANSMLLLGASKRMTIATGIANLQLRTAVAMNAGWRTVTEAYPGRYLLGIGVSHAPIVETVLKAAYDRPLSQMRAYLDAMDAAPFRAARPSSEPRRVLAALGPKMLQLSAEKANGAHPYFVPVEHTASARAELGPDALLAPEQMVVLSTDAAEARALARANMAGYLTLPNYANNLRRLGYGDADFADGASDRLVDAIVVWGDEAAIKTRVQAHIDAGADHVCVQVLHADRMAPPTDGWTRLSHALL